MTDDNRELTLKVDRSRWWSLQNQPFYGNLSMGLQDVISASVPGTGAKVKTAATDGKCIYWNPDYLAQLPDAQVRYILLHETFHPCHGHLWRLPADKRGNMAGDYEIEYVLRSIKDIEMPPGGLVCPPEWEGLACEEILNRLPDDMGGDDGDEPGDGDGAHDDPCGSFTKPAPDAKGDKGDGAGDQPGQGEPGDGDSDGDGSDPQPPTPSPDGLKEEWERRVVQAAQAAQALGQGDLPADLDRILKRVLAPTEVDWRQETADFARNVVSTRNDWSRSARRHAWQSVIYPRRRADAIGTLLCARDTSGSVTTAQNEAYNALGEQLQAELNCRVLLLDADAAIQAEYEIEAGEPWPATARGGGGTDFRPVFARAAQLVDEGETIAGVIYISDLYGAFPSDEVVPTLWLSTTEQVAPVGRTVRVRL